jgi:SAM-dependent methyltransferase
MDAFRQIARYFRATTRRKDRRRRKSGLVYHLDVMEGPLSVFHIASANDWRHPELTYQSANRFPSLLLQLLTKLDLVAGTETVTDIEAFAREIGASTDALRLGELFTAHGSDKARHGYHLAYAAILNRLARRGAPTILEIGLGTNNARLVSSMGLEGNPGASLRAFRDFLPASAIYGADVDRKILFHEERIKTAYVDQTMPSTFDEMTKSLGTDAFDLIVDDGLHSVEANMNTLLFALSRLKPGGWVVIEDIPERTVLVWRSVVGLINQTNFHARLVKTSSPHMVVAERVM